MWLQHVSPLLLAAALLSAGFHSIAVRVDVDSLAEIDFWFPTRSVSMFARWQGQGRDRGGVDTCRSRRKTAAPSATLSDCSPHRSEPGVCVLSTPRRGIYLLSWLSAEAVRCVLCLLPCSSLSSSQAPQLDASDPRLALLPLWLW